MEMLRRKASLRTAYIFSNFITAPIMLSDNLHHIKSSKPHTYVNIQPLWIGEGLTHCADAECCTAKIPGEGCAAKGSSGEVTSNNIFTIIPQITDYLETLVPNPLSEWPIFNVQGTGKCRKMAFGSKQNFGRLTLLQYSSSHHSRHPAITATVLTEIPSECTVLLNAHSIFQYYHIFNSIQNGQRSRYAGSTC
jgi:hypothetical protein